MIMWFYKYTCLVRPETYNVLYVSGKTMYNANEDRIFISSKFGKSNI